MSSTKFGNLVESDSSPGLFLSAHENNKKSNRDKIVEVRYLLCIRIIGMGLFSDFKYVSRMLISGYAYDMLKLIRYHGTFMEQREKMICLLALIGFVVDFLDLLLVQAGRGVIRHDTYGKSLACRTLRGSIV
jgi:hypothetical protein